MGRWGRLGPHIKFGGKIWGKVRPSSPNKKKSLGSSVTTRRKSWEKVPILGPYLKFRGQNLGYLSLIFLEAKFGAPTRISEANFGAKPPRPPYMEVTPGFLYVYKVLARPTQGLFSIENVLKLHAPLHCTVVHDFCQKRVFIICPIQMLPYTKLYDILRISG